ncbi:MAG: hypothetical protein ACRENS_02950 [Candidatus Eiseniibacteriota bacterium]
MSNLRAAEAADSLDLRQLRVLLVAILKARTRTRTRFGRAGQPRGLIFQVAIYTIMGGLAGMIAFLGVDLFSYELVLLSLTLFVSGLAMVAESGDLLFGANEFDVLGHRPVGARTLLLARSLALLALTALMAVSLNLGPLASGLWIVNVHPWYPLVHLFTVLMLSTFCAGAVVFAYALLSRLVGRERFEGIASWLQLTVTVTLILGYQVIPRLIDRSQGFHIALETPWLALFPPAWFAALASLAAGSFGERELMRLLPMAAAGITATGVLAVGAIARLANDYMRRLGTLAERPVRLRNAALPPPEPEATGGDPPASLATRQAPRFVSRWLDAWMPDPVERAAFRLIAAYMRRDRDLRMRLYPSLASYLAFPIIAVLDPRVGTYMPALSVVMSSLLPASAMWTLKTSSQYAASDIFRYAPLASTAALFHGARKAVLLFLTAPVLAVSGTLLGFAVHDREWLLAVVPAIVLLPTLSLIEGVAGSYLPFSVPPVAGRQGAIQVMMYLATVVLVGGLTFLGWTAQRHGVFWLMIGAEILLVAALHAMMLRGIREHRMEPAQ